MNLHQTLKEILDDYPAIAADTPPELAVARILVAIASSMVPYDPDWDELVISTLRSETHDAAA